MMSTGREITYMEAGRGMVWTEHFAEESELHAAIVDAAGKCDIERLTALIPHVTQAKSTALDTAIEHAAAAGQHSRPGWVWRGTVSERSATYGFDRHQAS